MPSLTVAFRAKKRRVSRSPASCRRHAFGMMGRGMRDRNMTEPIASDSFPYFGEEHAMLRSTIRRFIADRVTPFARCLGGAGLRAARDAARDGRARPARHALRARVRRRRDSIRSPTPCWRRSSARSTYGGFAVTVLVHTDMASPHLYHAGTREQLQALDAGHHRRPQDHRGGHDGSRRRLGPRLHAHDARARSPAATCSTAPRCSSPTACTATSMFVAAKTGEAGRNRR